MKPHKSPMEAYSTLATTSMQELKHDLEIINKERRVVDKCMVRHVYAPAAEGFEVINRMGKIAPHEREDQHKPETLNSVESLTNSRDPCKEESKPPP